ncbi:FitA-like ribbon-helix-helix domain-containing protein [Cyanobium sp. Alchichica 3B3-8F6]|uniref:FitA-like ribbon-helix-helix domain-containing protein n=1 Tax=Cyanobium sp. Alchichica 3B3-8F6 TaxID=2823696 RepID=UPI0020CF5559|nr:plasmid stabilization protein [Cyanobium sp. Alchichica 3B3-8F6]
MSVATLTIRNLDEVTKAQLRLQAARHGRSMEEEVRTILREVLFRGPSKPSGPSRQGLGQRIHAHFDALGGVELELPDRSSQPQPADLGA